LFLFAFILCKYKNLLLKKVEQNLVLKNLLLKKVEQNRFAQLFIKVVLAPPFPKVDLAQPFSKVEKFIPEV